MTPAHARRRLWGVGGRRPGRAWGGTRSAAEVRTATATMVLGATITTRPVSSIVSDGGGGFGGLACKRGFNAYPGASYERFPCIDDKKKDVAFCMWG